MRLFPLNAIAFLPLLAAAVQPQEILLNGLEDSSEVWVSTWGIDNVNVTADEPANQRFGVSSVRFDGDSGFAGSKGDVSLKKNLSGELVEVSLQVELEPDSNVKRTGIQVLDAEGEYLMSPVPGNWEGWKQLDFDLANDAFEPAYAQPDKNGKVDLPIKSVNFIWFTGGGGPTSVTIDGLLGRSNGIAVHDQLQFEMLPLVAFEAGEKGQAAIMVTNHTEESVEVDLDYLLQRNPNFYDKRPPHMQLGKDEALAATSWTESDGKRVGEGSLTDGNESEGYKFHWGADLVEAEQVIDLAEVVEVTGLAYRVRHGDHIYKVDISSSTDGEVYEPLAEFQGLDWHRKFGRNIIEPKEPFEARFLKFRYHKDGEIMHALFLPPYISVYDGIEDEAFDFPKVGELVDSGTVSVEVPARSFSVIPVTSKLPLGTGSYLLAVRYVGDIQNDRWMSWDNWLVLPPEMDEVSQDSPFGINGSRTSMAQWNRELGVGWVRFENLKWPMVSPEPNVFSYDGSVKPWRMNVDEYVKSYYDRGIAVLPYLFQVPAFESTVPDGVTKNIYQYEPKDFTEYGKFVFQTVARYGSKKHPESELLTEDKISGLGWINTFELWNEPDLNDPNWGHWVGEFNNYLEMMRVGAEAVKRADPDARIANAGLAQIGLDVVGRLSRYTYEDGLRPIDFLDVLSVHHYTGSVAPEIATVNTNVDRNGKTEGKLTFEGHLRELVDWRDQNRPEMEIWMTETGYDTGGRNEISVRLQAAWTPRNVLQILGTGIEKVMVYRESGSRPSLYAASGMLDDNARPRGSFLTYATLIRVMDGAHGFMRLPHDDDNVRIYGAVKNGKPVLAAWAVEGEAALGIDFGDAKVTDAFGHSWNESVGASFVLNDFPVYFEELDATLPEKLFVEAREIENARKADVERLRHLRAYLYDFGEAGVGAMTLGSSRAYTEIKPDSLFSEERSYGFLAENEQRSSFDNHWVWDYLIRDGLKVPDDTSFRVKAEPGRYLVRVMISPIGTNEVDVTLQGVEGDQVELTASGHGSVVEAEVQIGTEPLDLVFQDYGQVHWISVVEQESV
ncbi:hypothetical protein [Rubellicoccus peritrichatus]|uniref:F5/8 type C domain-containing protein n=1 Tax=Rubellicoccus peritrichatus TaxID=3080537 RepID=A0AAQ3L8N7_9BACT|nr:hypothetical protein [Puniceicoccus sp. CR14]WOO39727.1 hypothetical protein RZN69_13975 [Puniceicoccus sp. CR14]